MKDDQGLLQESFILYTRGLYELQKALWAKNLMYKDETLAACMALSMYEVMECPSKTGVAYVTHHKGCQTLLQLRGPHAHASGLAHQVFIAFRLQGVSDHPYSLFQFCHPNMVLISRVRFFRL